MGCNFSGSIDNEPGAKVKNLNLVMAMVLASLAMMVMAGCGQPLHHDLDEAQANAMVVALSQHGFEAEKIRDPHDGDRWAVSVPQADRVEAWSVLQQEGLPRPAASGFGDFYPGGGLIPTAQEERVVLQYATARELQTSLLKVDGIVDAHVHLVLPEQPRVQMSNTAVAQPRASVLVQWRDRNGHPPLDEQAIRDLVSGAVEGLQGERVHVVMTAVSPVERQPPEDRLVQVGPLSVSPSSQGPLKFLILMMGGVIIALSAGLVYLVLSSRNSGGVS